MLIVFILITFSIFLISLIGYKKIKSKNENSKIFQWTSWVVFCLWTLVFILGGMFFIQNNFLETNKVVAVIPVVLAFIVFLILYRKNIVTGGFNKNGR
jgi:L-asparagine transporter-like permease